MPYPVRLELDEAFDATIGFIVDDAPELGRESGHLPVQPGVCQPMGIVHGGVYAAAAETLASMGTARGVMADGKLVLGMSNNTSFLRPISEGTLHAAEIQATDRHQQHTDPARYREGVHVEFGAQESGTEVDD